MSRATIEQFFTAASKQSCQDIENETVADEGGPHFLFHSTVTAICNASQIRKSLREGRQEKHVKRV